jgi:hypothetical protein
MTVGKVKRQFISQISAVEGRDVFTDKEQVLFCSRTRLKTLTKTGFQM